MQSDGGRRRVPPAPRPDDLVAAERRAVAILTAADQSAQDLARKLGRSGFDGGTAEAAVGRMRELGYVDDSALAEAVVSRRLRQGYGWRRIRQDLEAHGLAADGERPDDRAAALALGSRLWARRRGYDVERDRARIARTLERRGFHAETIAQVLRTCHRDPAG